MNLVVQGLIDALFEGNETQQNQAIAQIEELHGYKIRYQNLILAAQKLRTAQESYYKSSPANKARLLREAKALESEFDKVLKIRLLELKTQGVSVASNLLDQAQVVKMPTKNTPE